MFSKLKDKTFQTKKGFVYEIPCQGNNNINCNTVYIGETSRTCDNKETGKIGDRKREHMNDYKKAKEMIDKINEEREATYATVRRT